MRQHVFQTYRGGFRETNILQTDLHDDCCCRHANGWHLTSRAIIIIMIRKSLYGTKGRCLLMRRVFVSDGIGARQSRSRFVIINSRLRRSEKKDYHRIRNRPFRDALFFFFFLHVRLFRSNNKYTVELKPIKLRRHSSPDTFQSSRERKTSSH